MSVQAVESFVVYFYFQGFFYFLFGAVFGYVVQTLFPFAKFCFVATAEKYLFYYKIAAVVVVIYHPIGNIMQVAGFYLVFDGVVNV